MALRNTPGMTREEYRRRAYVYHNEPPVVNYIPAGMEEDHENDVPVPVEGIAPPAPDYVVEGPPATVQTGQFSDVESDAFITPPSSPLSEENLKELAAIIADVDANLLAEVTITSQADMTESDWA